MRTIDEVIDQIAEIALELDEVAADRVTGDEARAIQAASLQCASASMILQAMRDRMQSARVVALAELCRCGHDRGDHLVAGPQACEHVGSESDIAGGELVDPCPCRAFESATVRPMFPRRDTLPTLDRHDTDRPTKVLLS